MGFSCVGKARFDGDNLLNKIKLEMGCWVHFLVHFIRVIGKCKSSTIKDGVDDDTKGKIEVSLPFIGLESWTCIS